MLYVLLIKKYAGDKQTKTTPTIHVKLFPFNLCSYKKVLLVEDFKLYKGDFRLDVFLSQRGTDKMYTLLP